MTDSDSDYEYFDMMTDESYYGILPDKKQDLIPHMKQALQKVLKDEKSQLGYNIIDLADVLYGWIQNNDKLKSRFTDAYELEDFISKVVFTL